jgi:peroxiredoxin
MKHFGIKFIISATLGAGSVLLLFLHYPLYAAIACTLAFGLNGTEIKEYSTYYQFINFHFTTLFLGYCVDSLIGDGTYYYTLAMVFNQLTGVLRLELLNRVFFGKHIWMEVTGLAGMWTIYIFAGLQHPADWRGWVLPALPVFFMTYICSTIIIQWFRDNKAKRESRESTELGKKAPDFLLQDVEGKEVRLSDFENKHHVLLIFVRGDWCPTCHIMIRAYETNREKFAEKNIIPIGISPDSTEVNKTMMERLGWKNMLLADSTQEIAKKYGILLTKNNPETNYPEGVALPASFLVDKSGILRYMTRSDSAGKFLSPSLIFPIIENLN